MGGVTQGQKESPKPQEQQEQQLGEEEEGMIIAFPLPKRSIFPLPHWAVAGAVQGETPCASQWED